MIKEFDNNEVVKYATSPVQTWLTDVAITIFQDSDGAKVVDAVVMTEHATGFYSYALGNLPEWKYSCFIDGATINRETFSLDVVVNNNYDWVLTSEEHNKLMSLQNPQITF